MSKTFSINVDVQDRVVSKDDVIPIYNQGDINSAILTINITQKELAYNLTGSTVSVYFEKDDGTVVIQDTTNGLTIQDAVNGKIQVSLNTQTLSYVGKVIGSVKIQNGSTTIETKTFYIHVEKSLTSEQALQSNNELSPLIGTETLATTAQSIKGAINEVNGKFIVYNVTLPPYNARGDGTTNDTTAIQNAINDCANSGNGYVYIPGKTFLITATTGLQIPSNIHIVFNPKAVIKANNTGVNTYQMLNIYSVSNVYIEGNGATIMGDKDTNTAADGEYGHGVSIRGCTNVYISNLKVTKAYGDGFYVGSTSTTTPPSENIYLVNCIADTNNRNGLSIINIKNMLVLGGEYKNSQGVDPQFGIDIEPNSNTQMIQNLKIDSVITSGNVQGGISLVPSKLGGGTNVFDVSVENYTSISDGLSGSTYAGNGIFLGNGVPPSGKIYGKIKFNKCTVINSYTIGVYFMTWQNSPRSVFTDVIVYNNDQRGLTDAENESAFAMDYFSSDPQGIDYGNITFERCGGIDNRATKLLSNAFYFLSDANHLFKNILIIDPIFEGNSSTWLKWQAFGSISTKFNTTNTVTLNTSTTLTGFAGQDIVASAAGNYVLPNSNNCIGLEFSLRCALASGTATLAAATGDSIINKGTSVTTIGLTLSGTFVKVKSIGNNQWLVSEQNVS